MDEVNIKHVEEWHNPNRVVVELEVKVTSPGRRAELLRYFRTPEFKQTATKMFAENTNSHMAIQFSNPRAKASPHTPLSESQTIMYSVVGALLAAFIAGCVVKACQQVLAKSVKDDIGMKRKHRSLATAPHDDDDAGEDLV